MAHSTRREALRHLAIGGGAAVMLPPWVDRLLAVADQHAQHRAARPPQARTPFVPKVFDAHQNETVIRLTDLIIPETDTPGAAAAHVNEYIDGVLADAEGADRDEFLQGLAWLDLRTEQQYNREFVDAPADQQIAILTALGTATAPSADEKRGVEFFRAAKDMTITGYYTSEIGVRQEAGDDGTMFFPEFKGCTHPEHGAGRH
jgi:hypothetical protein